MKKKTLVSKDIHWSSFRCQRCLLLAARPNPLKSNTGHVLNANAVILKLDYFHRSASCLDLTKRCHNSCRITDQVINDIRDGCNIVYECTRDRQSGRQCASITGANRMTLETVKIKLFGYLCSMLSSQEKGACLCVLLLYALLTTTLQQFCGCKRLASKSRDPKVQQYTCKSSKS